MPTCYAEETPTFEPSSRIVTAISQANPAEITTSFEHDYNDGLIVSFRVPRTFGMTQMDKKVGVITVTSPTTFTVAIDSRDFDAFSVSGDNRQCAQVIPVGGVNENLASAVQNVL